MSPTNNVEVRTIEDSIEHAHRLMAEAENTLRQLYSEVTGYGDSANGGAGAAPVPSSGLANSADRLASRLQNFVQELERTRARITSPNVQSLKQANYG